MELQRYESLAQAAERTGISRKALRRGVASGQLPVFSSGRRILRVRPEDVDAMLVRSGSAESSTGDPAAAPPGSPDRSGEPSS